MAASTTTPRRSASWLRSSTAIPSSRAQPDLGIAEGIVKHNGPLLPLPPGGALPATIDAFRAAWDLDLASQPGPEAQVAALADDIAYTNHDIDDAVRAGLLDVDALRRALLDALPSLQPTPVSP